jgi:hypothetical protein
MKHARFHTMTLIVLAAPFVACAVGDQSPSGVGIGPVTSQSETGDDAGNLTASNDAGTITPNNPQPNSDDDAGSLPSSNDAASPPPAPSDDAGVSQDPQDSASPPPPPPPPVQDSGSPPSSCPGYALPTTTADCDCDPTEHTCTANGCYNGYYCELSDLKCVKPPSGC